MTFLLWKGEMRDRSYALADYFTEYADFSRSKLVHIEMDSHLFARLYLSIAHELGANRILLQVSLVISLVLCFVLALVAQLFSRDMVQETEKKSPYECGFFPFDSATRLPFDVHFYVVGIMFLVFDVELVILTTITVLAATMPSSALGSVAGFVVILTIGFVYEWNCGALRWESKTPEPVSSVSDGIAAAFFTPVLLLSEDSSLTFYFELIDTLFPVSTNFFELFCFFWPFTRLSRGTRPPKRRNAPFLRRLVFLGVASLRRKLPKGQRWGWRWRLPRRLRIYRSTRWWRRRRQTTMSNVIPSWRARTVKYRFVTRQPWPFHLRWNKYKKRKRFWRYSYHNNWIERRPWTGYRSTYSYLRRLHALLLVYCVPSLHYHFTRMHRAPLIVVTSMFLIPALCVPLPWFVEDYDIVLRSLTRLYDRQYEFFLRNTRLFKEELPEWARVVVVLLSLYPAAALNIFFDYYGPSLLLVGLALARWWYEYTDADYYSTFKVYRRTLFSRHVMRTDLRERRFDAYEIRFQVDGRVPHPDKGYEDAYSRRLLVALLLLLPLFDWFYFPMVEPADLGLNFQALVEGLQPYIRKFRYYKRVIIYQDIPALCRAFNSRGRLASLTIILSGIVFGFTGLFPPFTWRLMYPRRKLRVWPPLWSAFVLWVSVRSLRPWWQHSEFHKSFPFAGAIFQYNHGRYVLIYIGLAWTSVFLIALSALYIWRALRRLWHSRYWVGVTRYRRINLVSNHEFSRHINAVSFDPYFMSDKGLTKKRAARLASGNKIKRYMLQTRVWWYFRD